MKTAGLIQHLIACLVCMLCQANALAQEAIPQATSASTQQAPPAVATQTTAPASPTDSSDRPSPIESATMPEIVGTWSRAESGTFSKLAIRPVEHHERLFFVEWDEGNGLLEWRPANRKFGGGFSFSLLENRSIGVEFQPGANGTGSIAVTWVDDSERNTLLRGGFAKTQRELDQKLSSDWKRVESNVEPHPKDTVAVVKTLYSTPRICELLRERYRDQPHHFFWNDTGFSHDTFHSVIVVAPADAQDDIEVALHQLDVP